MVRGFDFGNVIKVFEGNGLYATFDEYFKSSESKRNQLSLNVNSDFPDWNRINIYLSDSRLVKNVFLYQGKYLFGIRYWVDEGNVARDAIENIVFYPEVYEEFNFSKSDISYLERNNKPSKKRWIIPSKRPLDKDLLTTICKWTEIPKNRISWE
ncbi:hypothetical protein EYV94_27260 [Puteibacter caeruleilacunae]|nr:hypothetical protein EYV94_27260 [Puteibacter caeruleilacunae]